MILNGYEKRILDALSWHIWKSGLELVDEGAASSGTVYVWLGRLHEKELVVARERQLSQEQLKKRGGRGQREWKLTENGIRVRSDQSTSKSPLGALIPEL